ncbi:MAG TPA: tRNA (adenosine(37)-N6)-threonylcarbamoyltransferase complex transferase subunit TsaD [Pyrinomonadaceae bacterium]|nr:tRNA (adenosine(37)-N6)-threonylcarbamoyltransferase complex transferase subunit TsaD [Pyrinomonadaceae bacterium]HMP66025.1 tRNA (adenosine(37)-N6)-threonylcarbamoyltransferase complex transferase subunit TsaD [Pyrinomonadaceae bacterium]
MSFAKILSVLVLGIESSCDETAAALVRDGREILSSVVASQIDLHSRFGGVVPELASREHLLKIEPVVAEALKRAGVAIGEVDAVAVTQGPGLVGSLLVGVSYAKALTFGLGIPLVGVNHIEGHVYSIVFDNPPVRYPAMALIVSGGHTNLFYIPEEGQYELVSRTRDDAAGEAFDKVAKMLDLGYPGGPAIEKLAKTGDPQKIRFPRAKISDGKPDFSFSGLKTAVVRHLAEMPTKEQGKEIWSKAISDVAASFQAEVVGALVDTFEKEARLRSPKTLIVAGGVACNKVLREAAYAVGDRLGIPVYISSPHLSTDNAAMIAAAGYFYLQRGMVSDATMTADVTIRLQNIGMEKDGDQKRKRYKT